MGLMRNRRSVILGHTFKVPSGIILPHIMIFGHSQAQQEFSVYNGVDTLTGTDPGTATSFAKSFRAMGNGAVNTALAKLRYPLLNLPVLDPAGASPATTGNAKSYLLGDLRAQSGGAIADASAQLDRAFAAGLTFQAAFLWIGTNELPFDASRQAAHLALLQKAAAFFPSTKWAVFNIAPTTTATTSNYASTRSPANIDAANAMIQYNVAAMGTNFSMIDVCTPLRARGSDGKTGVATDFQNDGLHFATPGGGVIGKALAAWISANFPSATTNLRRAMMKNGGYIKDAVRLFNGATTTTFSQPSTGTGVVSGTRPSAIAVVSVPAAMNSSIAFSVVANPDTAKGGNCTQMVITCAGTATSESALLVISSVLNVSGSLAGKAFGAGVRVRDNNEAALTQYVLEAFDSAAKTYRVYHSDISAEPLGGTGARVMELWTPPKLGETDQGQMEIDFTVKWNPSLGGTITLLFDVELDAIDATQVQGAVV